MLARMSGLTGSTTSARNMVTQIETGNLCAVTSPSGAAPSRVRTIKALTALRGVVALWVVAHHCLQHSPAITAIPDFLRAVLSVGYVGVDIFFVLSGFVLAYVHTDIARHGIVDFARRRAARIYPLNFVLTGALVFIAAAGWDCGAPVSWPALPLALSMLQPFFLASPKWLLVNWSVGIELACYAGFPFTIMALRRFSWSVVAAVLVLAFWTDYQAQRHYSTFWWGWPALARCVPAFILGVAGYMFVAKAPAWIPRISTIWISFLEISFVAAILAAACLMNTVLIPSFAAALILLLYANRGVLSRCLSARPLVWLGDVSFSIYLVHLPIVVLLAKYQPLLTKYLPSPLLYPAYLSCVLIPVLTVSSLTNTFVERPGVRLFRSTQRQQVQQCQQNL